jgi:protein-S-isoprenylcysteine O-methyltransferase Ste14
MYLGALAGSLGSVALYRTWTTLFVLLHVPDFWVRARREEEALAAEFGDEWLANARRVPARVPWL